jgi:hypothetical protein
MVVVGGLLRGRFRVAWAESIGVGVWLRLIARVAIPSCSNASSGDDDHAPPSWYSTWACKIGASDALGVIGDHGTISGCRSCGMTELLKVAPATASVLASPSSSLIFMAYWA